MSLEWSRLSLDTPLAVFVAAKCSIPFTFVALQMIVGVLLFTPLLLLLPTTLVYYVLALGLHSAVFTLCQATELFIELLYLNPTYFAWCWAFQPNLVPGM